MTSMNRCVAVWSHIASYICRCGFGTMCVSWLQMFECRFQHHFMGRSTLYA